MESNYKKVGHALSKESIVNPNTRGMGSQLKKMLGETDGSSLYKKNQGGIFDESQRNSNFEHMAKTEGVDHSPTETYYNRGGDEHQKNRFSADHLTKKTKRMIRMEGDIMDDTMNTLETESNVQGSDSQMINNQITAMKIGGVKGGFYKKGTDHDGDGDIDSEDYMESRNQAIKNNS